MTMVFLDYKKVKFGMIAVTGFVPLFFMTLAMGGLKFNWIGGAGVGIASLIVVTIISNDMLSKNSWVRAIEKEGIMLFGLNSSGIVPTGIAHIKQNRFGQKLFSFKQGDEEVTRLYDRDVTWTLKEPMEGTFEYQRDKETGKKRIVIVMEETSFAKSVYFSDYLSCLFFNEQDGSFITKQELCDAEKTKMIKYLTLNEQREIRELRVSIDNLLRDYANRLAAVGQGLAGNSGLKWILIIVAVIVIGVLVYMFVPGVKESIGGFIPSQAPAVAKPLVAPITK
jgi:hypothetical protein